MTIDDAGATPDALDASAAELGADLHQAEDHFTEKLRRENAEELGQPAGEGPPKADEILVDKKGYIFDPDVCKVDEAGRPVLSKTGCFVPRSTRKKSDLKKAGARQKKRAKLVEPPDPDEVRAEAEAALAPPPPDPMEAAAEKAAREIDMAYWTVAQLIAADDPIFPHLQEQLSPPGVAALKQGMMETGQVVNLPWWAGASIIYGSASVAIARTKNGKNKVQTVNARAANFWRKLRGKRPKPEPKRDEDRAGEGRD